MVTTKVWNSEHGYDTAVAACRASLRRLGLDYVDLYLIHWPVPSQDRYVETWRALVDLRADGLVRSIGVSNVTPAHLTRLVEETAVVPTVNQVELHPGFQQAQLRAFHAARGTSTSSTSAWTTPTWPPSPRSRPADGSGWTPTTPDGARGPDLPHRHRAGSDGCRRVDRPGPSPAGMAVVQTLLDAIDAAR